MTSNSKIYPMNPPIHIKTPAVVKCAAGCGEIDNLRSEGQAVNGWICLKCWMLGWRWEHGKGLYRVEPGTKLP